MLSRIVLEPHRDIMAQISALMDADHPKGAVYLAPGNVPDILPEGVHIAHRPEGTLLTHDAERAHVFSTAHDLTDEWMAETLGYPEPKSSVANDPFPVVIQAQDTDGNVITECASSRARLDDTIAALSPHVPLGGRLVMTNPFDALRRRILGAK